MHLTQCLDLERVYIQQQEINSKILQIERKKQQIDLACIRENPNEIKRVFTEKAPTLQYFYDHLEDYDRILSGDSGVSLTIEDQRDLVETLSRINEIISVEV